MFLLLFHGVGAVTSMIFSVLYGISLNGISGVDNILNTFGYLYDSQGIYAFYIGGIVGFFGNGCFYYLIRYTSPLITLVIINFEPVTGTIFAWVCGYQNTFSVYTWVGGSILFVGNFMVTIASKVKNLKKETS